MFDFQLIELSQNGAPFIVREPSNGARFGCSDRSGDRSAHYGPDAQRLLDSFSYALDRSADQFAGGSDRSMVRQCDEFVSLLEMDLLRGIAQEVSNLGFFPI